MGGAPTDQVGEARGVREVAVALVQAALYLTDAATTESYTLALLGSFPF